MAVQKDKKSRSRRGMRRSHDALTGPTLSVDQTSGETHRRHHVTADGFYRGKKSSAPVTTSKSEPDSSGAAGTCVPTALVNAKREPRLPFCVCAPSFPLCSTMPADRPVLA